MRSASLAALALALAAPALVLCTGCTRDDQISRAIGAECDDHTDCEDRCLPPGDDFPGGFCTRSCASDDQCPSDAVCVALDDLGAACLFSCRDDRDCGFLRSSAGVDWACREKATTAMTTTLVCFGPES